MDCEKLWDPIPEVRKAQSGVPTEVLELGFTQKMPLGTSEEPLLGFLGHMEARDGRFSLSNIPDASVEKLRTKW